MPRISRIVIPHIPHHVIQRGNRRQQTFFADSDYQAYLDFLYTACQAFAVKIWAYCLMPNHVHLIAVPENEKSLQRAIGDCHQRYSKMINARFAWRGYLWQGRFKSTPMDEQHLYFAARYVEMNPVRANLCHHASDYRWSSAQAHLQLRTDKYVDSEALLTAIPDWDNYLTENVDHAWEDLIRTHTATGRPLGDQKFIAELEQLTGRDLLPKKRGPKPSEKCH